MTNYVAFWIMAIILAVFAADYLYFEWNLPLILGNATSYTIHWLAFWR